MNEEPVALSVAFRGYDRADVDRVVSNLNNQVKTLQQSNEALRSALAEQEETNLKLAAKVKGLPEKPDFSSLGAEFEGVLRLGERKAQTLVDEATKEAESIVQNATAKATAEIRKAQEAAAQTLADAESRANEMRLKSESAAASVTTETNRKLAEASSVVSTARREAASMIAAAESEIAEARSKFQRDLEIERAAMAEMREKIAADRLAADEDIRNRQEAAEQESMQRHKEALELANKLIAEANQNADEITLQADEIALQSERLLTESTERSDAELKEARLIASGIIDEAQRRAQDLASKTEEFVNTMTARANRRVEMLKDEQNTIDGFLDDIHQVRTTDMLIASIEEDLRKESNIS